MTAAEKKMVLYLIYDGGADSCLKCIHLNKPSCGKYVSKKDYSGECTDDYCIEGMIQYFENGGKGNEKVCRHCGREFSCKKDERVINFHTKHGQDCERVTLCPKCASELYTRRFEADDKFYKECTYGKQSDKKQAEG